MAKMTITTPGEGLVELEAADAKGLIEQAAFWQSLPRVCGFEGCAADVRFFHFEPQGYVYYGLVCTNKTPHKVNFGQHKQGGSLFYDQNKKWEIAQFKLTPADMDEELRNAPQGRPQQVSQPAPSQSQPQQTTVKTVIDARVTGDGEKPKTREDLIKGIESRTARIRQEFQMKPIYPSSLPRVSSIEELNYEQLQVLYDARKGMLGELLDERAATQGV